MSEEKKDLSKGKELPQDTPIHDVIPVSGMYENWFLDYASYVILERAVPAIEDGLKPVQRRILHAMKELDDGRYNKVANIIGATMQFHPHGDASIGDAMVNMGQKELLIDTQGNWGDIRTGDGAAAPRYIEARPSKFALDVVYNPQTTEWQASYDGRKKEPVTLPVKFPLLLAQGVEGIAVGLSTRILPHNFIELIKGSIDVLKGQSPKIYPDFPTGGLADFSEYNRGKKGGKVKIRARIEVRDKTTLIIKEIPFGTTTTGIIESIIKANEKGKIRIKQVVDNTAQELEIEIKLPAGMSPDIVIDALYAFTDCEMSISPNACVISQDKPVFLSVNDILQINAEQTKSLLKKELEIRKSELMEKILFSSLEKIFIENRIYRDIEDCETWEDVLGTIDKGLDPFRKQFYRKITEDDIVKLTEIKIKRISKYDSFKADELLKKLEEELKKVKNELKNLTEYAIGYFNELKEKYGKGRERKTQIESFENITAHVVAANNVKLFVNRKDGFVGYGLKKDEFLTECSDLDDIIAVRSDGKCVVSRISDKVFMGKNIMYAGVWKKGDERMVYNAVYTDGTTGRSMVKRFNILAITRDKEYDLTKGNKGSRLLYVTANPNGEAETIMIKLTSGSKARKKVFDFDFTSIEVKGRGSGGNILTKYPIRRIDLRNEGVSTLGGLTIWYDPSVGRLNKEGRGIEVGTFNGEDQILAINSDGTYCLTSYDLTNRFDAKKVTIIEKFNTSKVLSAVYYDGEAKQHYVKRFVVETQTQNKTFSFISESAGSKLEVITTEPNPVVQADVRKGKSKKRDKLILNLAKAIEVKGWKATGNRLTPHKILKIELLERKTNKSKKVKTIDQQNENQPKENKTVRTKTKTDKSRKPDKELMKDGQNGKAKSAARKSGSKLQSKTTSDKGEAGTYEVGTTIELDF